MQFREVRCYYLFERHISRDTVSREIANCFPDAVISVQAAGSSNMAERLQVFIKNFPHGASKSSLVSFFEANGIEVPGGFEANPCSQKINIVQECVGKCSIETLGFVIGHVLGVL